MPKPTKAMKPYHAYAFVKIATGEPKVIFFDCFNKKDIPYEPHADERIARVLVPEVVDGK